MTSKPTIVKGARGFSPTGMSKCNYIFKTIEDVYSLYGYQQIETPVIRTLQTLMSKYGGEGDKLLFKVPNLDDFLRKVDSKELVEGSTLELASQLCEKGLRYDLAVPFARYVVMHHDELQFPFKRRQVRPVQRTDRPQKGRYRKFYQCDTDVVGSGSLLNEVELVQIVDEVSQGFGVRVTIEINNRKILSGIAEIIGATDRIVNITVTVDKSDKISLESVNQGLAGAGISPDTIEKLQPIISLRGANGEKLSVVKNVLGNNQVGLKGVEEVAYILGVLKPIQLNNEIELDLILMRGLNCYTGAIFEVEAKDVSIDSITDGDHYDNLTGIFGKPGLSGVGISFGVNRVYNMLDALDLYPKETTNSTQILFINFGEKETVYCLPLVNEARSHRVSVEMYPDAVKMEKQMSYANAKQIAFMAMTGEDEMQGNKITIKNMETGEQILVSISDFMDVFSEQRK